MFLLKQQEVIVFIQFYSTSIMISSEEETSPVKGRAFKAHMKVKEKREKAKIVQDVVDDKMAEGKDTTKKKKEKASKGKDSNEDVWIDKLR